MNVDSGYGHKQVNLVQYRRLDGRWQFIRVVRKNGKPDPRLVLINGGPAGSNKHLISRLNRFGFMILFTAVRIKVLESDWKRYRKI